MLLYGGPYGNLQATKALLAEADRLGIGGDDLICTGDAVAYGADPQPVCDLLRARGVPVVMGNCEESLGLDSGDCGCGFADGSACDVMAAHWFAYCRKAVNDETRAWMGTLPRQLRFSMAGRQVAVVHGGADAINAYVFASTPAAEKRRQCGLLGADLVVGGHAGLPFADVDAGWINAGVIGLPANDGTTRGWYALLEPVDGDIRIELRPLRFDHVAAAARMRAKGLPEDYARAMETGLWPNCDILPDAETAARGSALSPRRLLLDSRTS
ncbi:MAG: metallophosphoesterase family protein [Acetobacterales bacterium]